jgi:hypothetical protein
LCFSNWRQSELPTQQNWPHLTFVKHFLLDAVFHSNTSTVEVLASIILTWPMSLRKQFWSITNTSDGPATSPLMARSETHPEVQEEFEIALAGLILVFQYSTN